DGQDSVLSGGDRRGGQVRRGAVAPWAEPLDAERPPAGVADEDGPLQRVQGRAGPEVEHLRRQDEPRRLISAAATGEAEHQEQDRPPGNEPDGRSIGKPMRTLHGLARGKRTLGRTSKLFTGQQCEELPVLLRARPPRCAWTHSEGKASGN